MDTDVANRPYDREHVRMKGDHALRQAYHDHAVEQKTATLEARRRLGEAYLAEHADWDARLGELVSPQTGIGTYDYSALPLTQLAIEEGRRLIAERAGGDNPSKGSLEFMAGGKRDFDPTSPSLQLAMHPALLVPAIRYLGMLPILFSIVLARASAAELLTYSSHLFHLDPEDTTQLKAFMHLVDIDRDTRPFHALPADKSDVVRDRLQYRTGRVSDAQVDELVGMEHVFASLGPAGTIAFCDTNRCFHFGGRPGARDRDMLMLQYSLPTSTWFPSDAEDGEPRNMLRRVAPSDHSPYWNPLIGASLL